MRFYFHTPDAHDDIGQKAETMVNARHIIGSCLCNLMRYDATLLGNFEVKLTNANGLAVFTLISLCIDAPVTGGMAV